MATIGIDMDGVIADFTTLAIKRTNELYGLNFKLEDMVEPRIAHYVYGLLSDKVKAKYNNPEDMYRDICPNGFFYDISPFKGAIEAVKEISKQHKIIFITKVLDWEYCPKDKKRWLEKYFPDMEYEILLTTSMQVKGLVEVDVIVEDDHRTIESLKYATGILIRQPWNENYINEGEGITIVNSMEQVPNILPDVLDLIYKW